MLWKGGGGGGQGLGGSGGLPARDEYTARARIHPINEAAQGIINLNTCLSFNPKHFLCFKEVVLISSSAIKILLKNKSYMYITKIFQDCSFL